MRTALTASIICLALCLQTALAGEAAMTSGNGMKTLDFREVVSKAKDICFPSVVFVKCLQENYDQGKRVTREISGSGVIISADGEFLTNWHVVDKAVEVRCLLFDGRAYTAKVLGSDKDVDLALGKLDKEEDGKKDSAPAPIPFAALGDSDQLKEGDFVMAMGAPWGLSRSVSMGIISCTRRYLSGHSEYSLWLQTDAAISPGNSGGPLINTAGEVVGINTLGAMIGGDLGFAIPSSTIKLIVPQLREHSRASWSYTGIQLQPVRDFNRAIYFDATEGVIVAGTDQDSPARRAGLQQRDRIIKVGGKQISAVTEEDLPGVNRFLGLLEKGKELEVAIERDGKPMAVKLTPSEKGKVEGDSLDCPRWDFTVKAINRFDNPDLHFQRAEGVFVQSIKYPGNAQEVGLQQQDILLTIDGKEVKTTDDVKKIHADLMGKVEEKHRTVISILRKGLQRQIVLDYERDFENE